MPNGPPSSRATPGCASTAAASSAGRTRGRHRCRIARTGRGSVHAGAERVHGCGMERWWRPERGLGAARGLPDRLRRRGPAELDEPTLVVRAQEGDAGAFEVLARRHQAALYRVAVRVMGDPVEAEDAAAGGADRRVAADRAVPRRLLVRHLDVPHRHQPLPGPAAQAPPGPGRGSTTGRRLADSPERAAELDAGLAALGRALRGLPDELRVCWVLRELEGLGYADIAQITGASEDAVRGRIHRARVRLAEVMRAVAMTPDPHPTAPARRARPPCCPAVGTRRWSGTAPRPAPPPDEHERGCPHCGAAFADAADGCTAVVHRMAAEPVEPPPSVLDRAMRAVRTEFRRRRRARPGRRRTGRPG